YLELTFENNDSVPLWIPQESEPAFRVDKEKQVITIFLGYFDEVYAPYRTHYMIPRMVEVAPRKSHRWVLSQLAMLNDAFDNHYLIRVQIRGASRFVDTTAVRGAQNLEGYLDGSSVIRSPDLS